MIQPGDDVAHFRTGTGTKVHAGTIAIFDPAAGDRAGQPFVNADCGVWGYDPARVDWTDEPLTCSGCLRRNPPEGTP